MSKNVSLRDVTEADFAVFFEQQRDPVAIQMAAFTAKDPADREAFTAKWARILGDQAITRKTILCDGHVAGNVLSFVAPWSGKLEVSYWVGREYWGRGVATGALTEFLRHVPVRPLYARVAEDNVGSLRVLAKCGFTVAGQAKGFANARGKEIEELILELRTQPPTVVTLDRFADLSEGDREEVRSLSLAVYPPDLSADWPGRDVEWSTPEWCVRVRQKEGVLLSYVGVYVRDAEWSGRAVRVGGIGNVKTHPSAQGQGLASRGIQRAIEFFRDRPGVAFGLLVCEPRLFAYYARQGWREFSGRLVVRQRGAAVEFMLNRAMTIEVGSETPVGGTIDLLGPPW